MNKEKHSVQGNTILVVDDEPDLVRTLRIRLVKEGFDVLMASTGEEAVTTATRCVPSAIILDVSMPERDGHFVARELRKYPRTSGVSIIFLTANSDYKNRQKALGVNAEYYIVKPFDAKEVIGALNDILRKVQGV